VQPPGIQREIPMPVILIRLPEFNINPDERPRQCPYCGSQILQRWGKVSKPIKDRGDLTVIIHRYRCRDCERTFRDYPEEIDRSNHARGLRRLAALLWSLGLSYRSIVKILNKYEINLSLSTVWRESQAVTTKLTGKQKKNVQNDFKIDKRNIHNASIPFGLVLAIDLGDDDYIVVGTLNEPNPRAVTSWLKSIVADTNIEIGQYSTDFLDQTRLPN
jgi:transposase-like protein